MLLIADETRGIRPGRGDGGLNSEIGNETSEVLLESAYFNPRNIRATSKKLELRTDASYRFERGGDIEACDRASRRAAQLILQTAGGSLAEGVIDAYPNPVAAKELTLRHRKTSELLGVEIPPAQQDKFLESLGLNIVRSDAATGESSVTVRIPPFRVDLKIEADLIEEVARLHGIEKIPSGAPRGAVGSNSFDAVFDQLSEARQLLAGLGLFEAQGQTLIPEAAARLAARPPTRKSCCWPIRLSSEMNALRPSLLPGLLDALKHNSEAQARAGRGFV